MKRNVRILLALAYFAVIALIVSLADKRSTTFVFNWIRAIPGGDKVGHFCLMGGFAFVANLAFACRRVLIAKKHLLLGSLIVTTLVTLEEFSQIWMPTRTFDLLDLSADFFGIWLIGSLAERLTRKERQPSAE
jgi:hypothetical protein